VEETRSHVRELNQRRLAFSCKNTLDDGEKGENYRAARLPALKRD
jgi:hypothetical protein